ncbi:MAG: type II toxin-antitoxin system VapC family toxin [Proteobacteria bacterium]|nr:type II toxin-antitoxin system VapC family toxin [Pseudomonadota bacterium]MBU2456115.1 type II toxin-antitoxin system VapC family toxin [Pseudomonadota bacterium]MBU2627122.1 type II toxin-antitoxin system VapC family toxin [Pseudomonadota bacterium]
MKILIDTHIFLWLLSCPEKLTKKRRYKLESPSNEVLLSSMSIAELMIKSSIGKIKIEFDPIEMAQKMRLIILDFSGTHAMALGDLPLLHKDPFDRMIIAQAICDKLFLMSDDTKFLNYDCKLI